MFLPFLHAILIADKNRRASRRVMELTFLTLWVCMKISKEMKKWYINVV